jgi:hypothetical protein
VRARLAITRLRVLLGPSMAAATGFDVRVGNAVRLIRKLDVDDPEFREFASFKRVY